MSEFKNQGPWFRQYHKEYPKWSDLYNERYGGRHRLYKFETEELADLSVLASHFIIIARLHNLLLKQEKKNYCHLLQNHTKMKKDFNLKKLKTLSKQISKE